MQDQESRYSSAKPIATAPANPHAAAVLSDLWRTGAGRNLWPIANPNPLTEWSLHDFRKAARKVAEHTTFRAARAREEIERKVSADLPKDDKTIPNWLAGRTAVQAQFRLLLRFLFYGPEPQPNTRLDEAWSRDARGVPAATVAAPHDPTAGEWEIAGAYQLDPGLLAFRIAKPTDNSGDVATLVAIFRFGHAEGVSRGKSTFLAVTEATLTLASDHYTAQPGTTLADRAHAHVRPNGEEQVIIGPVAGAVLHGDVIPRTDDGPGHLAVMQRNTAREGPVTATVSAPASHFRAWEPGRKTSAAKDAVIAAILNATLRKDRRGRVVLAFTTLRRRR